MFQDIAKYNKCTKYNKSQNTINVVQKVHRKFQLDLKPRRPMTLPLEVTDMYLPKHKIGR